MMTIQDSKYAWYYTLAVLNSWEAIELNLPENWFDCNLQDCILYSRPALREIMKQLKCENRMVATIELHVCEGKVKKVVRGKKALWKHKAKNEMRQWQTDCTGFEPYKVQGHMWPAYKMTGYINADVTTHQALDN